MSNLNLINFRDLAYLIADDGRQIKEGLIFRGPSLISRNLKETDKPILDAMHIKHLIDFRGVEEAEFHGTDYVPEGCILTNVPALELEDKQNNPCDLDQLERNEHLRRVEWLHQAYREMPFNNSAYQFVFDCLKRYEAPIYIHCSVGKDRTGVASALILKMLGFDDESIISDYMLSKKNWLAIYALEGKKEADLSPMFLVRREWIESSFKAIIDKYQSFDNYFLKEFNLNHEDIKKMREYYLK